MAWAAMAISVVASLRGVVGSLAMEPIMERLKRLAKKGLSQDELEVTKRVFDLATAQSWFDDTQYSRDGFAVALVGLFRCGITNPAQLERIAMFWALSDFSRNMSGVQRAKLRSLYGRYAPSDMDTALADHFPADKLV
ncbi:hypothetical protein ACXHMN_27340 [Rhizobium sp. LEGMi12c]